MDDVELRERLAQIDLTQAQLRALDSRLPQEIIRLQAERDKFTAETIKLYAEAAKLHRDRWLAPVIAIGAGVGSLIGAASLVYHLLR